MTALDIALSIIGLIAIVISLDVLKKRLDNKKYKEFKKRHDIEYQKELNRMFGR
jgi:hypothetical protein